MTLIDKNSTIVSKRNLIRVLMNNSLFLEPNERHSRQHLSRFKPLIRLGTVVERLRYVRFTAGDVSHSYKFRLTRVGLCQSAYLVISRSNQCSNTIKDSLPRKKALEFRYGP